MSNYKKSIIDAHNKYQVICNNQKNIVNDYTYKLMLMLAKAKICERIKKILLEFGNITYAVLGNPINGIQRCKNVDYNSVNQLIAFKYFGLKFSRKKNISYIHPSNLFNYLDPVHIELVNDVSRRKIGQSILSFRDNLREILKPIVIEHKNVYDAVVLEHVDCNMYNHNDFFHDNKGSIINNTDFNEFRIMCISDEIKIPIDIITVEIIWGTSISPYKTIKTVGDNFDIKKQSHIDNNSKVSLCICLYQLKKYRSYKLFWAYNQSNIYCGNDSSYNGNGSHINLELRNQYGIDNMITPPVIITNAYNILIGSAIEEELNKKLKQLEIAEKAWHYIKESNCAYIMAHTSSW